MDPAPSDRNLLWFPLCRVNQISPTHCFQTWERSNHIIKSPQFSLILAKTEDQIAPGNKNRKSGVTFFTIPDYQDFLEKIQA